MGNKINKHFIPGLFFLFVYIAQSIFFYELGFFAVLVSLLLLSVSLLLPIIYCIYAFRSKTNIVFIIPVFYLLLSLGWYSSNLKFLGAKYTLAKNEAQYRELMVKFYKDPTQKSPSSIHVEHTNPLRFAFPLDGMVDNWFGFCFDETGEILKINDKSFDDPSVEDIRKWFGGDLIGAEHMRDSWYFCSFT